MDFADRKGISCSGKVEPLADDGGGPCASPYVNSMAHWNTHWYYPGYMDTLHQQYHQHNIKEQLRSDGIIPHPSKTHVHLVLLYESLWCKKPWCGRDVFFDLFVTEFNVISVADACQKVLQQIILRKTRSS